MAAGGNPANLSLGPGRLSCAPLGTTEPADSSTALPSAWLPIGYTEAGPTITFNMTVEGIKVAEELDDVAEYNTGRDTTVEVEMVEMTPRRLALALGSGVIADAGTAYSPPVAGTEVSVMLVWDSLDTAGATNTRYLFRSCRPSGTLAIKRNKAPAKASLPVTFKCNKTAAGEVFTLFPGSLIKA